MMNILITGASGMVGSALMKALQARGHNAIALQRKSSDPNARVWNPEKGELEPIVFDQIDAVVNLAGENLMAHRWNKAFKTKIYDSRIKSTKLLTETINSLQKPPQILLNASAIGYYGSQPDTELTESSPKGNGFLAQTVADWEAAALQARASGTKVTLLRFGTILATEGGALAKMLPTFKAGAGATIGDGSQHMSWIALDDAIHAILYLLESQAIAGPVNLTAPQYVSNKEFSTLLAKKLGRPLALSLPTFAAKLLFGDMVDEVLLADIKAIPQCLNDHDFKFSYPLLTQAFDHLIS